jgi:hypothetical protein
MKKACLSAVALIFMMGMAVPLYAADDDMIHKSVDKFAHGTMEVMKSPLMLPDHTMSTMDEAEHKPMGLLKGVLEAPFHMLEKVGGGVMDIATFPIE